MFFRFDELYFRTTNVRRGIAANLKMLQGLKMKTKLAPFSFNISKIRAQFRKK